MAGKPRKIGPQQLGLLVFMARSDDELFPMELLWNRHSTWSFGTHSDTIRLLESLEKRGLVEVSPPRTEYITTKDLPWDLTWELTDEGRLAVLAAHPERRDLYPELGL